MTHVSALPSGTRCVPRPPVRDFQALSGPLWAEPRPGPRQCVASASRVASGSCLDFWPLVGVVGWRARCRPMMLWCAEVSASPFVETLVSQYVLLAFCARVGWQGNNRTGDLDTRWRDRMLVDGSGAGSFTLRVVGVLALHRGWLRHSRQPHRGANGMLAQTWRNAYELAGGVNFCSSAALSRTRPFRSHMCPRG